MDSKQRKWALIRKLRLLLFGFLFVASIGVSVAVGLLQHKPKPWEVRIEGTAEEMGRDYGRKLRWPMRLLTGIYLDRIVCQNNAGLIEARRAAAAHSVTNWPEPYSREPVEIAASSGISPSGLAYGNVFLDLGNVRAGCRSAVSASDNGLVHGHNLDWDTLGGLGRWTTCVVRRNPSDGRFRTVSVGFPGLVGALDIINEKGLALSFNQLGWGKGKVAEPVWVMMRRVAEIAPNIAEARRILTDAPPGMPFIITVSDAEKRFSLCVRESQESCCGTAAAKRLAGSLQHPTRNRGGGHDLGSRLG